MAGFDGLGSILSNGHADAAAPARTGGVAAVLAPVFLARAPAWIVNKSAGIDPLRSIYVAA